jgi:hypothetical protein
MGWQGSVERQMSMLRAWHLAILRFALTFDDNDRLNVIAIANEIDTLGRQREGKSEFRFFCKTSAELCAAILRQNESADAILRQYLARIDDARFKRAFSAALKLENQTHAMNKSKKEKGLWRGLLPRRDIRSRAP